MSRVLLAKRRVAHDGLIYLNFKIALRYNHLTPLWTASSGPLRLELSPLPLPGISEIPLPLSASLKGFGITFRFRFALGNQLTASPRVSKP